MITAASIGMRRQVYAISHNLWHYGHEEEKFDSHVIGAMAEFAVARVLNLFWEANIGKIGGSDVGGVVGVRMRRIPGVGTDLAIGPKDEDETPYVLVHGYRNGRMDLVGWLYGRAAKERKGPWCEPKNVWFVPPPYDPMDTLIDLFNPSARTGRDVSMEMSQ